MKNILFVCSENSARSQMAEAFFNRYNKNPEYTASSAGLKATTSIKPMAIEVMMERGIDISRQKPKMLTFDMIAQAHRIYTMGCVKTCPAAPPEKTTDWGLDDPSDRPIESFRNVRDDIEKRVKLMIKELD